MKSKNKLLRQLINSQQTEFLMEAHNALSGKIVEEACFKGIWASSLAISATMGLRDNNEASWTQILETVEMINDATTVPILMDADTGYGNFNNVRRLVKKLEQRGISGMCIEDKIFPKANSFIDAEQPLENIDTFCGKIMAAKDTQYHDDFCVVARTEAYISGYGLSEVLKRAEAYHRAGADAILVHSKQSKPDQIISFMKEWKDTCPVIIVPTKYYNTPVEIYEEHGVSVVIWANHMVRSCTKYMKNIASRIYDSRSVAGVESEIASIVDIFKLQNVEELLNAEKVYLK